MFASAEPSSPSLWRFGDFELDRSNRILRRAGVPVSIEPKVFDCLNRW